mmetsp:Transcript_35439/g.54230  ORF Transcript_35439/g.54230 Transcript_35439/m.54230 type:complete len:147 (+) Transcript_35439:356-796(+)
MVDKILKQDQGITYKALFTGEAEEAKEEEPPAEEGAEPLPPKEKLPRFKLVDEVVEQPDMHYYMVPRLGSYLAIKMEYESCLFQEAFDAAVVDFQEVNVKREEQAREKAEWEEKQKELEEEAKEEGKEFVREPKEWDVIQNAPFKT